MNPVLLLGLLGAVVLDWRKRIIPNWLTFSLAFVGLIFQFSEAGLAGFSSGVAGLFIGGSLLFLPFVCGGIGAGDVKLLAAVGAWMGPWGVFEVFLAAAVAGGVLCLVEAVRQKKLVRVLTNVRNRLFALFFLKLWTVEADQKGEERVLIPYAAAIAAGYVFVLYYHLGGG